MASPVDLVQRVISLRRQQGIHLTLLAVCPNSEAVLEAAVKAAASNAMPMLFAATLNQVDRDGGYTGWTPQAFVHEMRSFARKYAWNGPLYPCLDHGGPWLKDQHTSQGFSLQETMQEVRLSLTACVQAGYSLLHIDTTVDRTLPFGEPVPIENLVSRTTELIAYAESERLRMDLPPIAYEVGSEEVHGGLVEIARFESFLRMLGEALEARRLSSAWPVFIVGQVGTDLHTTWFDPQSATRLYDLVYPLGSLVKGHYTDWVSNPEAYPRSGMGGANVGPEFTAEEYLALKDLSAKETDLLRSQPALVRSDILGALEKAVLQSGRWRKWLQPEEDGLDFTALSPQRKDWLVQTGARYIWTDPGVVTARQRLYANLSTVMPSPHGYVVDRIAAAIDRYVNAYHLFGSLKYFEG